jgi:uncharacterized protein (TIGR02996 family)
MAEERDFLRAVLADPSLATPRLVYADWLDDQSDPLSARKAAVIRLEARLAETPERSLNRVRFTHQLQRLAAGLDAEWLAAVAHPALEACRLRFAFECPARWDRLTPTADVRVRHCGSCDRAVHYCDTIADARRHAAAGECVAVSPALVRRPDDLSPPRARVVAGRIRLSEGQLERLRIAVARGSRIGQPERVDDPEPPGPGIRPARDEEPDEPKQPKPVRRPKRPKRVRPEELEE